MNLTYRKYFCGGVNGVGKSHLLEEIARLGQDFEYLRGSHELMKYMGIVDCDYEKLRAYTQDERDRAYSRYHQQLFSRTIDKHLLMDAHYLNIVRGRVDVVIDDWLNGYDALLLVDAPLDDVWQRIEIDVRDRALFGKNEPNPKVVYGKYMEVTRQKFDELVRRFNKPSLTIHHGNNETDAAIEAFVTFHQSLTVDLPD